MTLNGVRIRYGGQRSAQQEPAASQSPVPGSRPRFADAQAHGTAHSVSNRPSLRSSHTTPVPGRSGGTA